jgi:hypothetical protein
MLTATSAVSAPSPDSPASPAAAKTADSVRHEAGRLAAQGRIEEAIALVERHSAEMPAVWTAMFAGKLELGGEDAARGYAGAAADSAPEQMRGEAVFRMGQYHYAAGRYHLAIPQFRLYLARHPDGAWSEESAYWMAHACIQYARARPDRAAYLDTALVYLRGLESKGRTSYYWPLARATQARVRLLRGDIAEALRDLREARTRAPAEEIPGILLLSLQADPTSPEAGAWEDSLRWSYPLSPEAQALAQPAQPIHALPQPPPPHSTPKPNEKESRASAGHALQIGAFSLRENAERLQGELAAKKITARIEPLFTPERTLYRVLSGSYPDAATAKREGERLLTPLGYAFRVVEQ